MIVFRYDVSAKKNKAAEGKVQAVRDNIKGKKHSIKSNEKESKVIDKEIAEMSKKLDEVWKWSVSLTLAHILKIVRRDEFGPLIRALEQSSYITCNVVRDISPIWDQSLWLTKHCIDFSACCVTKLWKWINNITAFF